MVQGKKGYEAEGQGITTLTEGKLNEQKNKRETKETWPHLQYKQGQVVIQVCNFSVRTQVCGRHN